MPFVPPPPPGRPCALPAALPLSRPFALPLLSTQPLMCMMCFSAFAELSSGHWSAFDTDGLRLRGGVVVESEQAATSAATATRTDQRPTDGSSCDIGLTPSSG